MVVQGNKKDKVKVKDTLPRSMKMKNIVAGYSTFATSSTSIPVGLDPKGYEITIYLTEKTDEMKKDVQIKPWTYNNRWDPTVLLYFDISDPIDTSIAGITNKFFKKPAGVDSFASLNVKQISIVGAGTGGNKTYFSFATYSGYDGNITASFKEPGRPNFVPKDLYINFGPDLLSISKEQDPNNPEVNGWEQKGQYEYYLYVKKVSLVGLTTPGSTIDERNVRNR